MSGVLGNPDIFPCYFFLDYGLRRDSSKLSSDQLAQMLKLLPTHEEENLLSNLSEQDKSNLGKPELYHISYFSVSFSFILHLFDKMRYLLEIMKIPKLDLKLECWHFSLTFPVKVSDLKTVRTTTLPICFSFCFVCYLFLCYYLFCFCSISVLF